MLNPAVIERYMNDLGKIIEEKNLKDKPHLIWNCDETGKQFEHQPVKVIAEKGVRNVVGRTTANRTNVTIMACVNAAGAKMSPLMIVKGKTSKSLHGFNIEAAPRGTKWDVQEKGWMTDIIGERWFRDIFLAECGPERPQMLILDGHSSHETLALLEMAVRENICILSLPPHTTHLLQPLDRSVFGPLNAAYNAACSDYLNENPLNAVNKHTFPGLLAKAWEQGLSVSNIISGFRACGIYPYNPLVLNDDAYAPSIPTDTPMLTATATSDTNSVLVPSTETPISARDIAHDSLPISTTELGPRHAFSSDPLGSVLVPSNKLTIPLSSSPIPGVVSDEDPFHIDDPELLLELLNSGHAEVTTANENGEAFFPSILNSSSVATVLSNEESEVSSATLTSSTNCTSLDSAILGTFLPPKSELSRDKKTGSVNRKKQSAHRLLTGIDILAEKRELMQKREEKEKKQQARKEKKVKKITT